MARSAGRRTAGHWCPPARRCQAVPAGSSSVPCSSGCPGSTTGRQCTRCRHRPPCCWSAAGSRTSSRTAPRRAALRGNPAAPRQSLSAHLRASIGREPSSPGPAARVSPETRLAQQPTQAVFHARDRSVHAGRPVTWPTPGRRAARCGRLTRWEAPSPRRSTTWTRPRSRRSTAGGIHPRQPRWRPCWPGPRLGTGCGGGSRAAGRPGRVLRPGSMTTPTSRCGSATWTASAPSCPDGTCGRPHLDRPKDRADLAAARLTPDAREWLAGTLDLLGHHDWAAAARDGGGPPPQRSG